MYIDKLVSYLFISFIQKSLLLSYYLFSFSYEEIYISDNQEIGYSIKNILQLVDKQVL